MLIASDVPYEGYVCMKLTREIQRRTVCNVALSPVQPSGNVFMHVPAKMSLPLADS